ncbi:unnamed protein product, partial [Didymodactylos carnosus]
YETIMSINDIERIDEDQEYWETNEDQWQTATDDETWENQNTFDQVEKFKIKVKNDIKNGIKNDISLYRIKQLILEKLNVNSLNSVDENYINHKYVKYCLQSWNDEQLPSILNEIKEKKDMDKLIDNVSKVKTIQDVLKLYPKSKCFQMLMENKDLLLKTDCDFILIQFKENIISCLKDNIDNTEQHNELLIEIENKLRNLLSIHEIHKFANKDEIKSISYIQKFLIGQISLSDFSKNFDENFKSTQLIQEDKLTIEKRTFIDQILNKLKCAFKKFVETNETKLITSSVQQIKKIIDFGLTSVEFESLETEKRNILIVKGVYISLNYILTTLEENLKNSVEVWLMASENLFIDCDIKSQIWRGKNMAICAKQIIIIDKRIIDVSGLNGQPENKPSKAENGKKYGTESDKNGKHGQNGMKGESGGNITIISETIENGNNLEIKANGGNGSYGQDGGDGVDGEKGADGHGLDMGEFKRTFPPAAAFGATQSMENVKKIIAYLEENATIIKSKKWGNTLGRHGLACYYIEAETAQGNLISFSYYWGIFTKQAYCFYRGTSGEPGTPGGFGGLGGYAGEPGLAGDIKILTKPDVKANIKTSAIDGSRSSDGQKGRDGNFGKSGENKPDVGYIDCQTWKEPVYYGPNWYKLSIYASSDTYRIRSSEYESITEYVQIELRSAPEPPACLSINEAEKHR